jgi:hypothetical protein
VVLARRRLMSMIRYQVKIDLPQERSQMVMRVDLRRRCRLLWPPRAISHEYGGRRGICLPDLILQVACLWLRLQSMEIRCVESFVSMEGDEVASLPAGPIKPRNPNYISTSAALPIATTT